MADVIAILEDIHLDYLTKYIILHDAMEELYADRDCLGPHPDLVSYDDRGFFPLLVAACLGSGDICAFLLECGCPVEQMVPPGHLADHCVAAPLHEVCLEGRLDLAVLFRRYSTDFRLALHQENHLGMSAGHLAVKSGRPEMVRWVCEAGYDVRSVDHHGNSLLHYACVDSENGSPQKEEASAGKCDSEFPVLSYLLSLDALSPLRRNDAGCRALHLVASQRFEGGPMLLMLRRLSGKLNAFEEGLLRSFVGASDRDVCRQNQKSAEAVASCRYTPGVLHADILALAALCPVSWYLTSVVSYLERRGELTELVRSVCEDEMLLSLVSDQINRIKNDRQKLMASVENVRLLLDSAACAYGVPLQRSVSRLLREGMACRSPKLVKLALLHGASATCTHLRSGYLFAPVHERVILLLIAGGMDAEQVRFDANLDTRSSLELPDLDYLLYALFQAGQHRTVKRLIGDIKGAAHSAMIRSVLEQLASPASLEVLSARVVRRQFKDKVFWYTNKLDVCQIIKTTLLLGCDVYVNSEPLV